MSILLQTDAFQLPYDDKGTRPELTPQDIASGTYYGQMQVRGSLLVIKDSAHAASGFIAFGNSITTVPTSTTPTPAAATGLLIDYLGITGWRSGVMQAAFNSVTGDITAGAGVVLLDVDGITLDDANVDAALIKWKSGTDLTASIGTYSTAGNAKLTIDINTDGAFTDGRFHLNVYNASGDTALFRLISKDAGTNHALLGSDGTFAGITIGGLSDPDAMADIRGYLCIEDGSTAPTAVSGKTFIYVDTADGDLKVTFGDGVTKTLATDT